MAGMGMARQNTGMAGMEILEASFRGEISIPKYYSVKVKIKFFEKKKGKTAPLLNYIFYFRSISFYYKYPHYYSLFLLIRD
jgi:hypothetical protein